MPFTAYLLGGIVIAVMAIILATLGSGVIYGLRREVQEKGGPAIVLTDESQLCCTDPRTRAAQQQVVLRRRMDPANTLAA